MVELSQFHLLIDAKEKFSRFSVLGEIWETIYREKKISLLSKNVLWERFFTIFLLYFATISDSPF